MVLVTDLLAFLAAVHDADEQAARAAADVARSDPWHVPPPPEPDEIGLDADHPMIRTADDDFIFHLGDGYVGRGVAVHIARHDPQSVLARVEAERLVISKYVDAREAARSIRETFGDRPDDQRGRIEVAGYGQAESMAYAMVEALAWGYRYREGFDPAWAPDSVEVGA